MTETTRTVDIVVDLETAGKAESAKILQIGAYALFHGDDFEETISFDSYKGIDSVVPFTHDADTMAWWRGQPTEIWSQVWSGIIDIRIALTRFSNFVHNVKQNTGADSARIWGFGATFDNRILRFAYQNLGYEAPWHYRGDMCFRTMKAMFPEVMEIIEPDAHTMRHTAGYDAKVQGLHLERILSYIGKGKWGEI